MPNHVIYDALWESDRLAGCSRDAALAYPWIFLVADDHGRFEFNPRRIWKHAFGYRHDVAVAEVAGWLDEYWRVGLLARYSADRDLAHWYKFKGRKPSERRPSEFPDPSAFQALPYSASNNGDEGATRGRRGGANTAPEIEQSRVDIEQKTERGADAPLPPPTPATPAEAAIVALRKLGPPKPGDDTDAVREVHAHWLAVMGKRAAKILPERRHKIVARLRDGYTVEQLKQAIDGCRASPFHRGENDKGRVYDDLMLICRNGSKVEYFIGFLAQPAAAPEDHGLPTRGPWEKAG